MDYDPRPGQIILAILVFVAVAFVVTRPEFRRRLAATPRVRIVSLVGLAVVAIAIVARVGGLI